MLKSIKISTRGNSDIITITKNVQDILEKSSCKEGVVNLFVRHTTCGIAIMEYEAGLIKDMKEIFNKIAPENFTYYHNKLNNDDNGSAHIKASILSPAISIPFENQKLMLGTWQQIVLIDFDTKPREREIIVKILNG